MSKVAMGKERTTTERRRNSERKRGEVKVIRWGWNASQTANYRAKRTDRS